MKRWSFVLLLVATALAGCGQKGDLYLPGTAQSEQSQAEQ